MQLERETGCGLGLALGEVRAARQPRTPSSHEARCRPAGLGVVALRMPVPEESCGGCAAGMLTGMLTHSAAALQWC